MKTSMISSIAATALALPLLASAWTLEACGLSVSGTESYGCTRVACAEGEAINWNAGPESEGPYELSIYSDLLCNDEIDHTPYNWTNYVPDQPMRSFLILN